MPRDPVLEVRQQACDDECLDTCVVPCECICHQRAAVAGAPRLTEEETHWLLGAADILTLRGYVELAERLRGLRARLTREEG